MSNKPKLYRTVDDIPVNQQRLVVLQHLGLGDHFICFGIVRALALRVANLYVLCKPHNHPTTSRLYSSIENVYSLPSDSLYAYSQEINVSLVISNQLNADLFVIGFDSRLTQNAFDEDFYRFAGVEFSSRYWSYSDFLTPSTPSTLTLQPSSLPNEFILVHSSFSHGKFDLFIPVDLIPVIHVDLHRSDNMLSWLPIAMKASVIHCVPSSFYCMVDSFCGRIAGRLYIHDIRADFTLDPNNEFNEYRWSLIKYDRKL